MYSSYPTSKNLSIQQKPKLIVNGICTVLSIACIISTNNLSGYTEPLPSHSKDSNFISTEYANFLDYNKNINLSWDGIYDMNLYLHNNLSKLEEIAKLPYNWNGNNAPKFSKQIISYTKKLLCSLNIQPLVLPTARPSIQLEYENSNGDYLEFEVFDDGHIKMFSYTSDKKDHTQNIDRSSVNEVVCSFYERNI